MGRQVHTEGMYVYEGIWMGAMCVGVCSWMGHADMSHVLSIRLA